MAKTVSLAQRLERIESLLAMLLAERMQVRHRQTHPRAVDKAVALMHAEATTIGVMAIYLRKRLLDGVPFEELNPKRPSRRRRSGT
jgi:hypothetical protein